MLTAEELNVVTPLAAPLSPHARAAFLQCVADQLTGFPPELRGPGLAHRLATEAQREFLHVAVGRKRRYDLR